MSSGKRPVGVFYCRHCHGVPRGGWAQAGTHHCLPLHWRSVASLLFTFLFSANKHKLKCTFPVLFLNFILVIQLIMACSPYCWPGCIFSSPPCVLFSHSLTIFPAMLMFPSSFKHFLITSYQTLLLTMANLSFILFIAFQGVLHFNFPPETFYFTITFILNASYILFTFSHIFLSACFSSIL